MRREVPLCVQPLHVSREAEQVRAALGRQELHLVDEIRDAPGDRSVAARASRRVEVSGAWKGTGQALRDFAHQCTAEVGPH